MAKPIDNGKGGPSNGQGLSSYERSWVFNNDGNVVKAHEDSRADGFTDSNEFLYVATAVSDYTAAHGSTVHDGLGGADQIILQEDALVDDPFFTNFASFSVLKLADGEGSTVSLATQALRAGIREVTGGSGDDTITFDPIAYAGVDVKVAGGGGDDSIDPASGNDWISGGDGNDKLETNGGSDTVIGGNGSDRIRGEFFATDADLQAAILAGDLGEDLMFAGALTLPTLGVYAEGADTGTADFVMSGSFADDGLDVEFADVFGTVLNWVEGRHGDDVLVASAVKDVFVYDWASDGGSVVVDGFYGAGFGTDTIHQFELGTDVIFAVEQVLSTVFVGEARADSGASGFVPVLASANGWSLALGATPGTATLIYDASGTVNDFTIELVGVQGLSGTTTVDDFFAPNNSV